MNDILDFNIMTEINNFNTKLNDMTSIKIIIDTILTKTNLTSSLT